jgi:hypothetical protein
MITAKTAAAIKTTRRTMAPTHQRPNPAVRADIDPSDMYGENPEFEDDGYPEQSDGFGNVWSDMFGTQCQNVYHRGNRSPVSPSRNVRGCCAKPASPEY